MVKYISSTENGIVVKFNEDIEDICRLDNFYMDYAYYIPEDGEWVYTKKDGSKIRRGVTKGSMVLRMYPIGRTEDENLYVFIENDELKDYYNRLQEKEKKETKKKATENPCDLCSDCECRCKSDY